MATVYQQLSPGSATFRTSEAFPQHIRADGTAIPVIGLAFDAAADEACYWIVDAINYGSGNLTLGIEWYADSASTGDVVWGAQIAAITPDSDTQDVETDALATAQTVTDTHLGTTGQRLHRAALTITNLDSLAARDRLSIKVYRDADNAADTMTGDAILVNVTLSYSDT